MRKKKLEKIFGWKFPIQKKIKKILKKIFFRKKFQIIIDFFGKESHYQKNMTKLDKIDTLESHSLRYWGEHKTQPFIKMIKTWIIFSETSCKRRSDKRKKFRCFFSDKLSHKNYFSPWNPFIFFSDCFEYLFSQGLKDHREFFFMGRDFIVKSFWGNFFLTHNF